MIIEHMEIESWAGTAGNLGSRRSDHGGNHDGSSIITTHVILMNAVSTK